VGVDVLVSGGTVDLDEGNESEFTVVLLRVAQYGLDDAVSAVHMARVRTMFESGSQIGIWRRTNAVDSPVFIVDVTSVDLETVVANAGRVDAAVRFMLGRVETNTHAPATARALTSVRRETLRRDKGVARHSSWGYFPSFTFGGARRNLEVDHICGCSGVEAIVTRAFAEADCEITAEAAQSVFDVITRLTNSPDNQEWVDYHLNTIRALLTREVVLGSKQMKDVAWTREYLKFGKCTRLADMEMFIHSPLTWRSFALDMARAWLALADAVVGEMGKEEDDCAKQVLQIVARMCLEAALRFTHCDD
ncbi:hypothetical protein ScalyP_jg2636, partial [Parmales sp. scaly parma]